MESDKKYIKASFLKFHTKISLRVHSKCLLTLSMQLSLRHLMQTATGYTGTRFLLKIW